MRRTSRSRSNRQACRPYLAPPRPSPSGSPCGNVQRSSMTITPTSWASPRRSSRRVLGSERRRRLIGGRRSDRAVGASPYWRRLTSYVIAHSRSCRYEFDRVKPTRDTSLEAGDQRVARRLGICAAKSTAAIAAGAKRQGDHQEAKRTAGVHGSGSLNLRIARGAQRVVRWRNNNGGLLDFEGNRGTAILMIQRQLPPHAPAGNHSLLDSDVVAGGTSRG